MAYLPNLNIDNLIFTPRIGQNSKTATESSSTRQTVYFLFFSDV